jgi:hypothetical protein
MERCAAAAANDAGGDDAAAVAQVVKLMGKLAVAVCKCATIQY